MEMAKSWARQETREEGGKSKAGLILFWCVWFGVTIGPLKIGQMTVGWMKVVPIAIGQITAVIITFGKKTVLNDS